MKSYTKFIIENMFDSEYIKRFQYPQNEELSDDDDLSDDEDYDNYLPEIEEVENFIHNTILIKCKPYISFLRKYGNRDQMLFRGIYDDQNLYDDITTYSGTRIDTEMPVIFDEILDDLFEEKFDIRPRRSAIFAFPNITQLNSITQYGYVYMVFPKGDFQYMWSPYTSDIYGVIVPKFSRKLLDFIKENGLPNKDNVEDFYDKYTEHDKFNFYIDSFEKFKQLTDKEWITNLFKNEYVDDYQIDGLEDLFKSKKMNEVMILDDCYIISIEYRDIVEKIIFHKNK